MIHAGRSIAASTPIQRDSVVLITFITAIFSSALLLFAIQPMFARMVLPLLGGAPAVWSVAMVFFQAVLMAGYVYAHLLSTRLSLRKSLLVHGIVVAAALLALPIGVTTFAGEPPTEGHMLWLLGVLALSIGLPFFALSANGPLLQAWFASSDHPTAQDPFHLYGASNLGSLAALSLYPTLFEPLMALRNQSTTWSLAFVAVGVLVLGAGSLAASASTGPVATSRTLAATAIPLARRLSWIALAAVPSGLLVAITSHVATDVSAGPFLWVVPLAIYLVSFILAFRPAFLPRVPFLERILTALATCVALAFEFRDMPITVSLALNFGLLGLASVVCHARMFASRPSASHLTVFYMCLSAGGVLGGLLCGLVAPLVFNDVYEYPILTALIFVCVRGNIAPPRALSILAVTLASIIPLLAFANWMGFAPWRTMSMPDLTTYLVKMVVIGGILLYRWPLLAGLVTVGVLFTPQLLDHGLVGEHRERSFFGVLKIQNRDDGAYRILTHGTTVHGAIRTSDIADAAGTHRPEPLTYYHPKAPLAEGVRAVMAQLAPRAMQAGVIGLGTGALACDGGPADSWTYFEIDPAVVRIATDPALFNYLSACAPKARIVLGDARLTMAKEAAMFDLLVVDAFSSDAIPFHLMTRQAIELYQRRLTTDGVLLFHISNRYFDLESILAPLARELGLEARQKIFRASPEDTAHWISHSNVIAMTRSRAVLADLDAAGWRPAKDNGVTPWTDDYINQAGALWRGSGL